MARGVFFVFFALSGCSAAGPLAPRPAGVALFDGAFVAAAKAFEGAFAVALGAAAAFLLTGLGAF
jgi:hypothetical protein